MSEITQFESIFDGIRRRNTFNSRYEVVKAAIIFALTKDGEDPTDVLAKANAEAELRTGISLNKVFQSLEEQFPSNEQLVTFDAFVNIAGGRKLIGVWSVLQMDTLGMFDAGTCLVAEFPALVSNHPELSFNDLLTKENILQYRTFVAAALNHCEQLGKEAEEAVLRGENARAADIGIAKGACDVYRALKDFADSERAAQDARDAAEKQRQIQEAEMARKDGVDRVDFKPLKDADRWLDRKEAWDRFGRTA